MPFVYNKKNVEPQQRNGKSAESKTIIKYVTQEGRNGADGADAFQVILSPNNHTFAADTDDQHDRVNVFVFRGTTPINSFIVESEIEGEIGKGSTNALTVDVYNNGTNQVYFDVNANSNLNVDSSTLIIPIQYNIDVVDSSTAYDASMWDTSTYNIATFNAVYSWNMASSGQSAYALDLSNENASINADASGNIISTAMRPTCKATLTYGAQDVSTGVTYSISYPSNYGVQGVSINSSTGVLTFNAGTASTPFRFGDVNDPNDTVLEITVDASFNNGKHRQKVMTITKSLPGQSGIPGDPGDDAVSRWIELSADAIRVDASNNCIPPTITATPWKQIGGNTPAVDQSTNIKWAYDSSVTSTAYTGAITINSSKDYMTFKLYYQSTYLGECETVPILRDGKNGQPGAQGRKGPAVRGPVLWDSSTNSNKTGLAARRFCNGDGSTNDADGDWLDIIIHNGNYYVCTTSYNSTVNDTWSSGSRPVTGYWSQAQEQYDFIATKLLLANNAKINFLSGNEIYLMNSAGTQVTAGAAGGNGISFWAGANNPSDAPFQVNYDGNLIAKSGKFSGFVQYPYKDVLELSSIPTFNKNSITKYGTYTFDASTQYANLISRTIHHYKPSPSQGTAVPFTRNLVLPFPTEDLNGFTYNILVTMYATGNYDSNDSSWSGDSSTTDNACLHISVNSTGHQNDTRLSIDNYAFPDVWTCKNWTIEFGSATITCVPFYGNASDGQASTIVGYRWTITQASGIITADTGGSGSSRYKHFTSLSGRSDGNVKPIYEIQTYTGTRPSPSDEDNIMFVKKNS